jgi:hypothetical protein
MKKYATLLNTRLSNQSSQTHLIDSRNQISNSDIHIVSSASSHIRIDHSLIITILSYRMKNRDTDSIALPVIRKTLSNCVQCRLACSIRVVRSTSCSFYSFNAYRYQQ